MSLGGFELVRPTKDRAAIARAVLEDLPVWFGIPSSRERYIARADELPMVAAAAQGEVIGFLSLERRTVAASEIHVVGVRRAWHRRGVGRAIVAAAADQACKEGARYLIVKTVSDRLADPNYAATRGFYEAVGFVGIDELPDLWGPENPCLVMLKELR